MEMLHGVGDLCSTVSFPNDIKKLLTYKLTLHKITLRTF